MKTHRALVVLLLAGLSPSVALSEESLEDVSLVQLVASPERYEGKMVMVSGFVNLEFEGNGIYLHKDDYEHGLNKNGLWLNANECKRDDARKFTNGYALVIGRFTSQRQGHMGLWSGEIQDVKSCTAWPPSRRGT
ncbi:hypothetical protein [Luteimonas saliphila]|uniref:hypothetical protein n=1 Tax=Luteimonas saliphila TaxID=2804919 RepID=UPI00192DAEC6|nr:hypothetical protein [Luteimonas saliphila]